MPKNLVFLDPHYKNIHSPQEWSNYAFKLLESSKESNKSIAFTAHLIRAFCENYRHEEFISKIKNRSLGLCSSFNFSLNSKKIGLQKLLSDFSFSFIEASAFKNYLEKFLPEVQIDHLWCPEGISNLDSISEIIKAHNFPLEEIIVLVIPENGIKAIRKGKYEDWTEIDYRQEKARFNNGKIYEFNKEGKLLHEIELVENRPIGLNSPIYKLKLNDRWVLLVHSFFEYDNLLLEIKSDFHTDKIETEGLSLGAFARKIFKENFSSDWEMLPEAKLFVEGGSWTSIITENSSSNRHLGVNNMFDVLKHKWHEHKDVAIPWNYLGFDLVNQSNSHLLDEDSTRILSLKATDFNSLYERPLFLEVPQNWKKVMNELFLYFTKTLYAEFSLIATKRYQLSIKELTDLISKYLGQISIYKKNSKEYKESIEKLKIPIEIQDFLVLISNLHKASASFSDFYSSKTNPESMFRLQQLAKVHKGLKRLCPYRIEKFEKEINSILAQDLKSEFTILADLYYSEFNKIKDLQVSQ